MIPSDNLVRWWNDNYVRAYRREVFSSLLAVHEYHGHRDTFSDTDSSDTSPTSSTSSVWSSSSGYCEEDVGEAAEAVYKCLRFHLREYAARMRAKPDGRSVLADPQTPQAAEGAKESQDKPVAEETVETKAPEVAEADDRDEEGAKAVTDQVEDVEEKQEGGKDAIAETREAVTGVEASKQPPETAEQQGKEAGIIEAETSEAAPGSLEACAKEDPPADQTTQSDTPKETVKEVSVDVQKGCAESSVTERAKRKSPVDDPGSCEADEKELSAKRSRLTLDDEVVEKATSPPSPKPDCPAVVEPPITLPEDAWEHECDCYTIRIGPPFQQKAYVLVMTHSGLFDVHYDDVVRSSQPAHAHAPHSSHSHSRPSSSTTRTAIPRPRTHTHTHTSTSSLKLSLQQSQAWPRRSSKKVALASSRGSTPSSPITAQTQIQTQTQAHGHPHGSSHAHAKSLSSLARWHDPSLTPHHPLATRVRQILEEEGLDFEDNGVRFCKMPICMI